MNVPRNRELGAGGEESAAAYLSDRQFTIIKRNYRFGKYGEIDIIAGRGMLVIFVEVKSRSSERFGGALYSISARKKQSLKTAARAFIQENTQYNDPAYTFRFDMISVYGRTIDWIEDIFR
ncbi:MAG TPA: YraN family protein [Spirochaetota bacterium]|nr:YraN family protein [Spirochaetota bacterium]HOD15420.1 YraN family protein [Spirochaetota bacterium]HPG50244.1 YraN family protein [Spirochaetota bacterium]HPN11434.1 YraN family protein [Spirochaetota bacterium]